MLLIDLILARPWEAVAVALSIAYVVLAADENLWCWPAALVSTAIFSWLFWDVSLLMESALNVYYLFMAIYGWRQWTSGSKDHSPQKIHRWSPKQHLAGISLILILTLISGSLLSRYTQAALPFLDSLTTWAAVVTTFMVARKVLENWLYWIVIDAISVYLYLDRELYLTCALFLVYIVIAIYGWYQWKGKMSGAPDRVHQLIENSQQSGFFENKKISIGTKINWSTINECWILHCEDGQYLARLGRTLPRGFLSNWKTELQANQIAANAGLAPMPVFSDEASLSAIYPWCGDPISDFEFTPTMLKEIADKLSPLHRIEASTPQIPYRLTIENYLSIIGEKSNWIEESGIDVEELLEQADQWDQSDDLCFCHHDLTPRNILWDGAQCTFIDWEYARVANPLFDIATLSKHFDLSDDYLDFFLAQYSRRKYSIEQVRSAETFVLTLEILWLEAARLSLLDTEGWN